MISWLDASAAAYSIIYVYQGFLGGSTVKNLPASAGDAGYIPGSRKSPREGNSNPLQYAFLGNPMDRGTRWAIVHEAAKELDTT